MYTLKMELGEASYNITVGNGLLARSGEFFDLDRRVLIVTDENVPIEYAKAVSLGAKESSILVIGSGEGAKTLATYEKVLLAMADASLTRSDAVVAVGGGVVGDLVGFAAASYMRGIDFYNVPTTVLSMVDSSIGGKTAVNLGGIKNIVGAFHQPKGVLIDTDTLSSLDERQIANGLCEAVKMAMTSDEAGFELFESLSAEEIKENIEKIIISSLKIKKAVVEEDEHETGVRRILNFGHTLGHGIESLGGLYHGECVALGMIPVSIGEARERLIPVLKKIGAPTEWSGDVERALQLVTHDKKRVLDGVRVVLVEKVGSYKIEKLTLDEFSRLVKEVY